MDTVRTRDTVEGALLAALTALMGLLSFYTGFGLLQPLPVLLAYRRRGAHNAMLVAVVSSVVLALWIGPLAAIGGLGFVAAQGLTPGWALRRGWGFGATVAAMAVAMAAVGVLGVLATNLLFHMNVWAQSMAQLGALLRKHAALVRSAGLTPAQALDVARQMIPIGAIGVALTDSIAVYLLGAVILGRLGAALPAPAPFREWRMPPWTAWGTLVALAGVAAGLRSHAGVLTEVAANLLVAAALGYTVTALALAYGWLRGRGLPRRSSILLLVGGCVFLLGLGLAYVPPLAGLVACHLPRQPDRSRSEGDHAR